MMTVLFFLISLSFLGLILLVDHIKNRFRHSAASRRILTTEAVFSVVTATVLSFLLWRDLTPLYRVGSAILLAVPSFIIVAFITVEVWRYSKQEGFNREISRLLRECKKWQEHLERLNWELRDIEMQREMRDAQVQQCRVRLRALEDQLQAWEQAGSGLTRLIHVEQWTAELSSLDRDDLIRRREELASQIQRSRDIEERKKLSAYILTIDITLLRRELNGPGGPFHEIEKRIQQLREERQKADRSLMQLREELRHWQERKNAFLREKIPLD